MPDLNISLSLKIDRDLDAALEEFSLATKRERACAVRYLLEIALAAHHHRFAEGLLELSPINNKK